MSQKDSAFIDGVASAASHNGVHRVACYKLDDKGKPEPSIELLIPNSCVQNLVEALSKLRRP